MEKIYLLLLSSAFDICAFGQKPVANFAASTDTICAIDFINYTDLSTNNPTGWKWSFPGGLPASSSDQNPLYVQYLNDGSFAAKLVVSNSSGSDSLTVTNFITVHRHPPIPSIYAVYSCDTLYCSTDTSYVSYQWYNGATLIPNATDTFFIVPDPCISCAPNVQICNAAGCCIAVSSSLTYCVGVHSLYDDNEVVISPNPATNQLTIQSSLPANTAVSIINMLGQVASPPAPLQRRGEVATIDVSKLPAGIYFLELKGESGRVVKKFVKE